MITSFIVNQAGNFFTISDAGEVEATSNVDTQVWADIMPGTFAEPAQVYPATLADAISQGLVIPFETAATFSAISTSTQPRLITVQADESAEGEQTLYFHNGNALTWIPTQEL